MTNESVNDFTKILVVMSNIGSGMLQYYGSYANLCPCFNSCDILIILLYNYFITIFQ